MITVVIKKYLKLIIVGNIYYARIFSDNLINIFKDLC